VPPLPDEHTLHVAPHVLVLVSLTQLVPHRCCPLGHMCGMKCSDIGALMLPV
jgi:hypothetical protein